MDTKEQRNSQVEKIRDLIDDIKIGMMTTVDDNGNLVSRPMEVIQIDKDGGLWFFTKKDTSKTDQINHNEHRVNVTFSDVADASYVSVSGYAEEIYDRPQIDELWSSMAKPWFPGGKDDPALILLKVNPYMAEYWDSTSIRIV